MHGCVVAMNDQGNNAVISGSNQHHEHPLYNPQFKSMLSYFKSTYRPERFFYS